MRRSAGKIANLPHIRILHHPLCIHIVLATHTVLYTLPEMCHDFCAPSHNLPALRCVHCAPPCTFPEPFGVSHTSHPFPDSQGTPLAHALTSCAPSTLTCASYTSPTHAALLTNLCVSLHTTSHRPCLHGASHACLPPCNIAPLPWSSCTQDSKEWIKLKEAEKIYSEFDRNII